MSDAEPLVEPRTLKGFQDFLPEEALLRRKVIRAIESAVQNYGFTTIETPALEHLDVLLGAGGEETNKEMFRLESPEGEPAALRFDQTVPLARLMAQYPARLKPPFRRYALGSVWRADKPGPGRFREFTQFDLDIAGSDSVAADAEIIAMMGAIMEALGASRYTVLFNNRRLLDALLEGCGIHERPRQKHVMRVIDKLAKVGDANVRLELGPGRTDESGDPIPGVRLDGATIDTVMAFIGTRGDSRADMLERLAEALGDAPAATAAVDETRILVEALDALGMSEEHARFMPSLTRGLEYYTGPVFEMILPDARQFASVMGGGRYDGLVSRFLERSVPCTGMGVGVDRLIAALRALGVVVEAPPPADVLMVTLGNVPLGALFGTAQELRRNGIRTQTYLGAKKGIKHQLSHADHYGIPIAVILGEDEVAKGMVSVKDLRAGKEARVDIGDHEAYRQAGKAGQVTVPRAELVKTIVDLLQPSG